MRRHLFAHIIAFIATFSSPINFPGEDVVSSVGSPLLSVELTHHMLVNWKMPYLELFTRVGKRLWWSLLSCFLGQLKEFFDIEVAKKMF